MLTNLSPVKMTAGEAWHSPRPYAKPPFRLLCPINSQNGLSVYRRAFWHDPSKSYGYAIMSWGGRSIFAGLFYHYILNKRFIVSRQGKKNAKVKDTGRVKYIAMERRTPPAGAKAAICVYPSRSAVSESCQGNIIYQSTLRHRCSTKPCKESDYRSMIREGAPKLTKFVSYRDIRTTSPWYPVNEVFYLRLHLHTRSKHILILWVTVLKW